MANNPYLNLYTGFNGFGAVVGKNNPYSNQYRGTVQESPWWKATSKATPKAAPAKKPPEMTAEEWARAQAEKYIASLVAGIEEQRRIYLEEVDKQSRLETERGAALADALLAMDIPSRVGSIYGAAGDNIAGYAKAFSGTLRDTATADAAQQTRMVSGTGQEGAVASPGVGMGDVLYGSQGYIPARTMAETGAAFAAQAALEPGFARRIGQLKASEAHAQGMEGLDEFTNAITEAKSGQFEVEQNLLKQRQDSINDEFKIQKDLSDTAYKRLKDQRDYYIKQAYLAVAQGNQKRANQYLALAQGREDRMVEHEDRMAAKDQGVDVNGNLLPGYKKDANGNIVKVPKPSATNNPAAKAATARKEREDEFRAYRVDAIKEASKLIIPADDLSPEKRPPYQVAFRKLWELYKDWLRFGTAGGQAKLRARLTKMIEDALAQNGFVKPVHTPDGKVR